MVPATEQRQVVGPEQIPAFWKKRVGVDARLPDRFSDRKKKNWRVSANKRNAKSPGWPNCRDGASDDSRSGCIRSWRNKWLRPRFARDRPNGVVVRWTDHDAGREPVAIDGLVTVDRARNRGCSERKNSPGLIRTHRSSYIGPSASAKRGLLPHRDPQHGLLPRI